MQGRFIHDEKLTGGRKRKKSQEKMTVDAVAAAVILTEYLQRPALAVEKSENK
jgi:RNase H-fold protein (predicted Holliday junction resolvase)